MTKRRVGGRRKRGVGQGEGQRWGEKEREERGGRGGTEREYDGNELRRIETGRGGQRGGEKDNERR